MSVIVMKVIKAEKHPNANALRVYQMVDYNAPRQIVANISTVYQIGDNVIVALPGSILKDGTKIKEVKIRGTSSYGMALGTTCENVGTDLTEEFCDTKNLNKTSIIKWPDIENLHNVVRNFNIMKKNIGDNFLFLNVTYAAKVKIHGSNAAVQIASNGEVFAQSRTKIITQDDDNAGFAKWVEDNKDFFSPLKRKNTIVTFFGEWCGVGVQKNTAINQIGKKIFAIFCVQFGGNDVLAEFNDNPEYIKGLLSGNDYNTNIKIYNNSQTKHPDIFVIPWCTDNGKQIVFNFNFNDKELLKMEASKVNELVTKVEQEDPWVKDVFGISGIGEGVVLYPQTKNGKVVKERTDVSELMFKAKGEKHKVVKQREPAQIDPEIAANIEGFVSLFVTDARLEQGLSVACNDVLDPKLISNFIKWINKDVQKESVAELEASKLEWKQVAKFVSSAARNWYLNKISQL